MGTTVTEPSKTDFESLFKGNPRGYWDGDTKPILNRLISTLVYVFGGVEDDLRIWEIDTRLSKALEAGASSTIDDYGALHNVKRNGEPDKEYLQRIISKLVVGGRYGTANDVITACALSCVKTENSLFADLTYYPKTRFSTVRLEGGVLDAGAIPLINASSSSGTRILPIWSFDRNTLLPAVNGASSPSENIAATLDPSNTLEDIVARLSSGAVDNIVMATDTTSMYFVGDIARANLTVVAKGDSILRDHLGEVIDIDGAYAEPYIQIEKTGYSPEVYLPINAEKVTIQSIVPFP